MSRLGTPTPIPRWSAGTVPAAIAAHTAVADGLGTACERAAAELSVPLATLLLAAHAKVVSALAGRPDVVAGLLAGPDGDAPLLCRLDVGPGAWRDLVRAVDAAQRQQVVVPLFDAVLDLGRPDDPRLPAGAFASAGAAVRGGDLRLVVRHRADAMDAAYAARFAGYHVAALRQLVADPGADHQAAGLLSGAEVRFQLEDLAGRAAELPDRRFHELFRERADACPDAVAAEHAGRRWTFAELRRRANRVSGALLAAGVGSEDVVAVATERDLDWMAAVIGVLQCGGAYLPVEPRFPPDRVATMLAQSGCRLALTSAGADGSVRAAAGGGVEVRTIGELYERCPEAGDPDVRVGAHQLAYVFFTSGSTGRPKGAMVEHAGMLNHLLAKVEDMGIEPGVVVAQTAPQCFDISVWQLLAGPLAGGTTLIVEQAVLLDVERLAGMLDERRVGVLQLVPSHLDVLLAHLERRPRRLPALRRVSATGEALSAALVERWFASQPDVPLVNAYGLTETSDDTNHEVMRRPPENGRVVVGRPVRNVDVSVVDERLALAPLGAAGELVFSGVCAGRGYVNDPRLTEAAFGPDPHRPGRRMYRSGDFGRWLPDGRLEFLGRRDAQVKVRGFRIEIGEVEHRLSRAPGLRECAAVAVDGELVAFYTGPAELSTASLSAFVGAALPEYMVPTRFHRLAALPRTDNGKTDRRRLARLAAEPPPAAAELAAPATPTERWLAEAWSEVLGIPAGRVARDDDFFARGGTSLSAVRLAIRLDRRVSLEDLARHPVLRDLARLVDAAEAAAPVPAAEEA